MLMESSLAARFNLPPGYHGRMRTAIACLLVALLALPAGAQKDVRSQVGAIPIGNAMTVETKDGHKLHGRLSSIDADSFSLREVDLQILMNVRYEETTKISRGFGRKGFAGQRVDPRRSLIVGMVIIGGLLALVFGAVLSDRS